MNPAQLIENRSTQLIFRDCLKLAPKMVEDPVRVLAIRRLLKHQFGKNREVYDPEQIRALKLNAVRGISNYIIHTVKEQYIKPNAHHNILNDPEEEDHSVLKS